eukprot:gene8041-biopygen9129
MPPRSPALPQTYKGENVLPYTVCSTAVYFTAVGFTAVFHRCLLSSLLRRAMGSLPPKLTPASFLQKGVCFPIAAAARRAGAAHPAAARAATAAAGCIAVAGRAVQQSGFAKRFTEPMGSSDGQEDRCAFGIAQTELPIINCIWQRGPSMLLFSDLSALSPNLRESRPNLSEY